MAAHESPEEADVMEIFDDLDGFVACRVCGGLVARTGAYPRTHWDWHEASNGA